MKKRQKEKIIYFFLGLLCVSVVTLVIAMIGFTFVKGLPVMNWTFISQMPRMGMKEGGILPAIIGTLYLMLGTVLIALPLGILSAIYLTEYAKRGPLYRGIRLAIFNLAGVPSVVYGLFGLGLFVLFLGFGSSLLSGCLTLSCLILPVIIASSEEALLSVDPSYREASLALGATRWQTIQKVVLPHAMPGILTGAILGMGRAAGETAPILLTAVAFFLPKLPQSVFDQVMALPYHLYIISTQVPDMPAEIQYGTAFILMAVVGIFFGIATWIRYHFRSLVK